MLGRARSGRLADEAPDNPDGSGLIELSNMQELLARAPLLFWRTKFHESQNRPLPRRDPLTNKDPNIIDRRSESRTNQKIAHCAENSAVGVTSREKVKGNFNQARAWQALID
jgi:hypothetical protein